MCRLPPAASAGLFLRVRSAHGSARTDARTDRAGSEPRQKCPPRWMFAASHGVLAFSLPW
jgi:hypothetical protein